MINYDGLTEIVGAENVRVNEPMARHTSFRIGGPADYFVRVTGLAELQRLLQYLRAEGEPWYVLGRGTNLLVGDGGYRGCVITMNGLTAASVTDTAPELTGENAQEAQTGDSNAEGFRTGCLDVGSFDAIHVEGGCITAGAGASLAKVARAAWENGLTGLEFAAGIPGTVGGALVMNAGAYDGSMDLVVREAAVLMPDGSVRQMTAEELRFGYRRSVFKEIPAIALQARMELQPGDPEAIQAKMKDFAGRRRDKQPLEYPSAGSTFKRPEGMFAGKLIMDAGLRGFAVGDAAVSEKHCGFVVNKGNASAADVRAVIAGVQQKVLEQFGVQLEEEVIYLGEF